MALKISPKVREKLTTKHRVNEEEIAQCFGNRTHCYCFDVRAEHRTNPITRYFISETDVGRKLKVAFIPIDGDIHIRTAFEPDQADIDDYTQKSYPL